MRSFCCPLLAAFALAIGCGGSPDVSSASSAVTSGGGSGSCDLDPAHHHGELPACAAGTTGPTGPGVPVDFAGALENSMPLTPAEKAAVDAANVLAAARHQVVQHVTGAQRSGDEGSRQ